jgi:nicotinamidase-related amidase/mannose-6-phosphate isomerase-like protein (cupin superfamily)
MLPVMRSADMPIIWLNWGNRPDRLNLSPALIHVYNPDGRSVGLGDATAGGAAVLEKNSWGAAIVDGLATADSDIRVDKFRMSGFWDTPLDSILRTLGVTTLLFGGVNLDQCVLCTLQDANFLGYDCILIEDCAATTSPEFCTQATLYNIRQCFGFTASASDISAAIAKSLASAAMLAKPRSSYRAARISPNDTNRFILIFDPTTDPANFVFAVEIFDVGGRTPPNVHKRAHEMFFVLSGTGRAWSGETSIEIASGDCVMFPPGVPHVIENTGRERLYCLTYMTPNEGFAELIRAGEEMPIDDTDWAIIRRGAV